MPQFNQGEFNQGGFNEDGTPLPASPEFRVFAEPGTVSPTSFGELRFRLLKAVPGTDPDLLDGWIQDRYQFILDRLPWNRIERSAPIQGVAPYQAGTVSIVSGDINVSIDPGVPVATPPFPPGAWNQTMTGRALRIVGRDEYYEFTATSETTGVIDRPYEGPGGSGLAYIIFATVYLLPGDCREVRGVRSLECPRGLERKSKQELNYFAANRAFQGKPAVYAPYMDYDSAPPQMQMEVFPAPDCTMSMVVDYIAEQPLPGESSTALLPWMRPGALYEGARASALEQAQSYAGADRAEAKFLALVQQMVNIANRNTPAEQIRMAPRFVRHRIERAIRSQPRRTGGWS